MKVLFCDNEFGGWEEARTNPEQYAGRPLDGLTKYSADFFGLKSWVEMSDTINWDVYDLIWVYMGHRKMVPSWYTFPRLIRQKAPNAKIVFTTDYEGLWFERPWDLRIYSAWNHANAMHTITKWGFRFFKRKLSILVRYGHFGNPHAGGIKNVPPPVPISKRKGIVFIRHTNMPSISTQLEIIKRTKMSAIILDSVPPPFSKGEHIEMLTSSYALKNVKVYPRLEFSDYLKVLSSAYVGIDNHVGPSRFSQEMAVCKVPVVHSEMSEYGNVLFPRLICPHGDISSFVKMIRGLRKSPVFYQKMTESGYQINQNYFNLEECQKRLDKFIKEIME